MDYDKTTLEPKLANRSPHKIPKLIAALLSFYCGLFPALILQPNAGLAQSLQPTSNIIFNRVVMVQSKFFRGTAFSIDVNKREYWITAKHILTGAEHPPYGSVKMKSVILGVLRPAAPKAHWLPVRFEVIDPGSDIDIVVLAPLKPLLTNPLPSEPASSAGLIVGGDCEFLGYPYGNGWLVTMKGGTSLLMPFIKHCTISGLLSNPKRLWVLDGINNDGFSGGPVIFGTGPQQKIMAVVSGYWQEPEEVTLSGSSKASVRERPKKAASTRPHLKGTVELNSGFIFAYDIKYAIDAINKDPIGPLRKQK